jgi:hypothetical protein
MTAILQAVYRVNTTEPQTYCITALLHYLIIHTARLLAVKQSSSITVVMHIKIAPAWAEAKISV